MFDKVFAVLSMASLAGFLAIILRNVTEWELGLVCLLAVAACGYDFYRSTFGGKRR